jgi:hypothetical protein
MIMNVSAKSFYDKRLLECASHGIDRSMQTRMSDGIGALAMLVPQLELWHIRASRKVMSEFPADRC